MRSYVEIYGKDLCVVRDPGVNSQPILALTPYRHATEYDEEWETHCGIILLGEPYPEVKWESEPLHVTLEQVCEGEVVDDNVFWLCRNEDETLSLSYNKPYRNEVNPWWSCPNQMNWYDDDLFPELTWQSEPIRVQIVKI